MNVKYYIFCLFLLLFKLDLIGQCGLEGGILIINELGNTSAGDNGEFIELLVIGSSQTSSEGVDLSNWIIDDNNASDVFLGNEPGHIRLSGSCFSAIPSGSIILLYNPAAPADGIDTHSDGMPNEIGVYQIPITSPCIEKHNGCPDHVNSSYGCPIDESSYSTFEYESVWNNYIPMRNLGDGIQIRNPYAEVVSSVYWVVSDFPAGGVKINVPNGTVSQKSIQFIGNDDWLSSNQYIVTDEGSPGFPNSEENAGLINSLQNGETNSVTLDITFSEMTPSAGEPLNNGVIAVNIIEGMGSFEISYSGAATGMFTTDCSGYVLIPNLATGLYYIEVTDVFGCVKNGSVNISENAQIIYECPNFTSNQCELEEL